MGFWNFQKNTRKEVIYPKKNFWGDESSFGTDGWICKKKRGRKAEIRRRESLAWPMRMVGTLGVFFPGGHITTENDRESPPPELDSWMEKWSAPDTQVFSGIYTEPDPLQKN